MFMYFFRINHGCIVCLLEILIGSLLHIIMKLMLKEFELLYFLIIPVHTWILR